MFLSLNESALGDRLPLERRLELIREAGFDAVDINLEGVRKPETELGGADWEEAARKIRAAADRLGLIINQIHAPFHFSVSEFDEQLETLVIPVMKRVLRISQIFGVSVAVIHPIHHHEYLGHEEEFFANNMKYYAALLPTAHETGVKLGIENMWQRDRLRGTICHDTCSRLPEFLRYVDTLNDPFAVACLDVGHVGLCPPDNSLSEIVLGLGDRLQSLHVHDNDFRGDQHLPPYEGKMDWDALCRSLGQIGYKGFFTYELHNRALGKMDEALLPSALRYYCDLGRSLIRKIEAGA